MDSREEPVPGRCLEHPAPVAAPVIAVVGAGFSGTMAAVHLRRALSPGHGVVLLDGSGRFARGPAYAESEMPHLLNVRVGNMSAFPDDAGHFERWVAEHAAAWPGELRTGEAGTFATRRLYGRYLRSLLFREMRASGGRVRLCADEVTAIEPAGPVGGWRLRCRSGREIRAAAVVVAVGNLPSPLPADGVVFHDPWAPEATEGLRQGEPVLIVGTGLTMVDLAQDMAGRGFGGPIIALSRRGLVPKRHEAGPPLPPPDFAEAERRSLLSLLRALRRRVAEAARAGIDWRRVIDGLRPISAALWRGLPPAEQARFLRHLRPYWDVHRHRMAPAVADAFTALVEAGRLRLRRGRVGDVVRVEGARGPVARVTVHHGEEAETLTVQRVIFATGAGKGAEAGTLVGGMIAAGTASSDALGLGIAVTEGLQVLGGDGQVRAGLWALGPIVRGVFWECTAVPDIRVQARMVAKAVAASV